MLGLNITPLILFLHIFISIHGTSVLPLLIAVLIILILDLLKIVINLLIKAECRFAGVGFLLLAIFAILALVNKMWLQMGIFAIIFAVGAVILLISAHILFWIEEVRQFMD